MATGVSTSSDDDASRMPTMAGRFLAKLLFVASILHIVLPVPIGQHEIMCNANSSLTLGAVYEYVNRAGNAANELAACCGPQLRVGIVTYGSENIMDYARYSLGINTAYAAHNGYMIKYYNGTSFKDGSVMADVRWAKIALLRQALDQDNGWARDFDYIAWVDADLVFLDFGLRLELLAPATGKYGASIIASAEHAGSSTLINSGCVVVRNTKWGRQFLNDWWDHADRSLYSDQEQFDLLYEHRRRMALPNERSFTDHVAILPPDAINSDPPAMTQQKPGSQGEESAYRVKVFREGLSAVCEHLRALAQQPSHEEGKGLDSSPPLLPRQLGLTQPNLLRWALETYSAESADLLAAFETHLPPPSQDRGQSAAVAASPVPIPQSLEASRRMANTVHHFAHALLHSEPQENSSSCLTAGQEGVCAQGADEKENGNYRQAVILRKKVYQLLRRNLVAWKRLRLVMTEQGPAAAAAQLPPSAAVDVEALRADWPELLKVTSIAGQHLLSVTSDQVVSQREKRSVAGEILTMMQEMLMNSHEGQHDAILLMVADIHQQIGVLDLALSYRKEQADSAEMGLEHVQAALHHFELALEVTTSVAESSGQHLLIAPMTLTANALASLGQFQDAFIKYERALQLNEQHLGRDHSSNVPLLVDFGISLLHAEQCLRAQEVFQRAEQLLEASGAPHSSVEAQRVAEHNHKVALKCGY